MDVMWSQFSVVTATLVVLMAVTWAISTVVSPTERRMVTSAALVLAGLFFISSWAHEGTLLAVGIGLCAGGMVRLVRSARTWRREESSWTGRIASLALLPPAFFGAVLFGGLLFSVLEAPARLAMRIALG